MNQNRPDRQGPHRTQFEKNRQIIFQTQAVCGICGQPVDLSYRSPHPLSPTIDHIIPVSKGGHPSEIENLQLAHRWCNRWKSDKIGAATFALQVNEIVTDNRDLPQHADWKNYSAVN